MERNIPMEERNLLIEEGIPASLWQPIQAADKEFDEIRRPSMTYWQDAWRRFKENKTALVSLAVILLIAGSAIFVPMLTQNSYFEQNLDLTNLPPSAEHWFGTDNLGRDLFVRVLIGARVSLAVAFVAMLVNFFIGVLYGGISGYLGGRTDIIMMRIVDTIDTIPLVLYAILIMVVFSESRGFLNIIIALGSVYWVNMARIVRGQILALKEQEFVLAAKVLGASTFRILIKHLIPNAMGTIIVTLTMFIPTAIFTEAFLSFLGLGVSPPMTSWGALANDAVDALRSYPYQLFFPAAAISVTMLAFNLLGDGLRDSLDPRLRK